PAPHTLPLHDAFRSEVPTPIAGIDSPLAGMVRMTSSPASGAMPAMAPTGFSRGRPGRGSGRSWLQAASGARAAPVAARLTEAMKRRRLVMGGLQGGHGLDGASTRRRVGTSRGANPVAAPLRHPGRAPSRRSGPTAAAGLRSVAALMKKTNTSRRAAP